MTLAYMQGMLYPRASEEPDDTGGDDDGDDEGEDGFETPDDPLAMATALMPASMGITFCVRDGESVDVTVHGARYKPGEKQSKSEDAAEVHGETWKRVPLTPTTIRIEAGTEASGRTACLEGMASVSILPRRLQSGRWLLTVSLSNENEVARPDPEKTEPPRVSERLLCSKPTRLFQGCSSVRRTPPPLLAAAYDRWRCVAARCYT
ncbi:hypothetical protein, partial [Roseovarius salinarum]|uniref:hypothetical protein n=1 Tax=Roseovarius salinarum TaxID=1981892 RepID=UPI001E485ED4